MSHEEESKVVLHELSRTRKYRESIPDWMDELCVAELGEDLWTKEIAALNQQAKVYFKNKYTKYF